MSTADIDCRNDEKHEAKMQKKRFIFNRALPFDAANQYFFPWIVLMHAGGALQRHISLLLSDNSTLMAK